MIYKIEIDGITENDFIELMSIIIDMLVNMVYGVEERPTNNVENSDRDNCVCNYYNGKYLKYIINKCTDSIAAFFNSSISFVRDVSALSEVQ